jgi:TRAP-type C4-dicarboxylate transport system permease small subunit
MITLTRPPRPRLTARILAYALADVFGLACVSIGASWFVAGKGAVIEGFPASMAEAVACTAGGVVVMFWAVARILREIAKQGPELQARYRDYMARNHPGKHLPGLDDEDGRQPPK